MGSASVKVPIQWPSPQFPAALTQRSPLVLASAMIAAGVPGSPVPSPRVYPKKLPDMLITRARCATAKSFALPSATSVSTQIR